LRHKKFSGTLGPVRAPTFIRNTTRVDYNPERCKDYYETGRCNFGDSCVFIHDRSDYKSGWQLDQEFEAEQKRKQLRLMGHDVSDGEENYEIHSQQDENLDSDGLPLVCRICETLFRSPVQTQCGHYFCETCALTHYSTSGNCF
jgi:RING finger protein 113A